MRTALATPDGIGQTGRASRIVHPVNEVLVFGIPGGVPLREGDVEGIDCGVLDGN